MTHLNELMHRYRRETEAPFERFDQQAAARRIASHIARERLAEAALGDTPGVPAPRHSKTSDQAPTPALYRRLAANQLVQFCRLVVTRASTGPLIAEFIKRPGAEGARVFGCLLHLMGRSESAEFWWRFAGGADDAEAALCLSLHHTVLGELRAAEHWAQRRASGLSVVRAEPRVDPASLLKCAEHGIDEYADETFGGICVPAADLPERLAFAGRS